MASTDPVVVLAQMDLGEAMVHKEDPDPTLKGEMMPQMPVISL